MTIFGKIIRKEIPAQILYEDELCMAFRDVSPKAPTHVLMIPKKEIHSMVDLKEEDAVLMGHMLVKVSEIAKTLGLAERGYRVVINTKDDGGQSVFHLHMHLLGGREMGWPPG